MQINSFHNNFRDLRRWTAVLLFRNIYPLDSAEILWWG